MKGFFKSRLVLTLVAGVLLMAIVVLPLSGSIIRSRAAGPSSLKGNVPPSTVAADPFNTRLAIQVGTDGRFNIGAYPDPSTGGATSGSWDLMYSWPGSPGTSYTTLNIDGSNSVYGSSGTQIQAPQDTDAKTNQSSWQVGDIQASQTLQLALNDQTAQEDNAKIDYSLTNKGTVAHMVGLRIMIDTEVNGNDGAILRVPGTGLVTKESEFTGAAVPDTMQSFFDVTDTQHVAAVTLKSAGATPPDRLVIAAWPHLYNAVYDYTIDPNYDFTDPSVARPDSGYAVYWNPVSLAPGQSLNYVTYYGLSQLNVDLSPPLALGVSGPATLSVINNAYSPNPFTVTVTVLNNGTADANNVALTLHLPTGLSLASGTATQDVGTLPVGQERDISWSVQASSQTSEQTLTYSVDAVATNTTLKNVARQITLPPISTGLEGQPSPSSPLVTSSDNTVSVQTDVPCSSTISQDEVIGFFPSQIEVSFSALLTYPIGATNIDLNEAAENENLQVFDTGGRITPVTVPFGQLKNQPRFTVPANDKLIACIQGADGDEVGLIAFTTSNLNRLENFLTLLTHTAKCTIGALGPAGAAALLGLTGFQVLLDISDHKYSTAAILLRNLPIPGRACVEAIIDVVAPGQEVDLISCLTGDAPIDRLCKNTISAHLLSILPRFFVF